MVKATLELHGTQALGDKKISELLQALRAAREAAQCAETLRIVQVTDLVFDNPGGPAVGPFLRLLCTSVWFSEHGHSLLWHLRSLRLPLEHQRLENAYSEEGINPGQLTVSFAIRESKLPGVGHQALLDELDEVTAFRFGPPPTLGRRNDFKPLTLRGLSDKARGAGLVGAGQDVRTFVDDLLQEFGVGEETRS